MIRKLLQYKLKWLSILILAKYKPKVVAITGSVGKSSAKEAIFTILNSASPGRVRANLKNLNTEIGVPLTIIGGEDAKRNLGLWFKNIFKALKLILIRDLDYPDILVLEMAADRPGDIRYLTSFIFPDVAVVTAIGEMPVHLEFFLERDIYIKEKANIIKNLKPHGLAILNYDDLSVREMRNVVPTGRERVYYGFQAGAQVKLEDFSYKIPGSVKEIGESGMLFKVSYDGEESKFFVKKTLGVPALYAGLAGIAVGLKLKLKLADMAESLKKYALPHNRLELLVGVKETIIIDDSYNASPIATEAALGVLAEFKKNRKIAVLGSMRELGTNTEQAHRLAGVTAAKICDIVFLVGPEMVFAREELEKKKFILGRSLFWFETADEAKLKVQEILEPGDVVLIKGSLSISMGKIVEEIKA